MRNRPAFADFRAIGATRRPWKRLVVLCLVLCSLELALSRSADAQTIITLDVPGARDTTPRGINPAGAITGFYEDIIGGHGFLRAPNGALTTFDVPAAVRTSPRSINPLGAVTGLYYDASFVKHSFLRAADGNFTTFDAPGASTAYEKGTVPPEHQRGGRDHGILLGPGPRVSWLPADPGRQLHHVRCPGRWHEL